MMKRCENALRTGQTENLFPVLARRTSEIIAEEVRQNRREWANQNLGRVSLDDVVKVFRAFGRAATATSDAVSRFVEVLTGVKPVHTPMGTLPPDMHFLGSKDLGGLPSQFVTHKRKM